LKFNISQARRARAFLFVTRNFQGFRAEMLCKPVQLGYF